jgi:hypothetical protein
MPEKTPFSLSSISSTDQDISYLDLLALRALLISPLLVWAVVVALLCVAS